MELPILSQAKSFAQTPSWDMLATKMSHFSTPYSTSAPVSSLAYAPNQIAAYVETKMDVEIAEAERKVNALRAEVAAQRARGQSSKTLSGATAQRKGSETQMAVPTKCTSPSKALWCQNQTSVPSHVIASPCNDFAAEQNREYSNLAMTKLNAPWRKPMMACKGER
jgi:hypothetical protein